ncbi:DUF4350 domain-containing protein [Agromyces protaetiae]|uniref:DUF4350 domain-containing protein n=1 Tax=Agromyces protaetiae TaxID=2509455 RepID=A0A4P6FVD1_9MICO|nr:DUF4350 domain-containing protein [Agromyces protaetiae]QAY74548.1 DUF4350 domain-containing protein [Agromyces protaetiae]
MSAPATVARSKAPDASGATPAESRTPTFGARLRRSRTWLVFAALAVAAALILFIVQGLGGPSGEPLGPADASPAGSKAVVEVLRAHGVAVEEVRTFDRATESARRGATVFAADLAGFLDTDQWRELAGDAERLVVADPDFGALQAIAPGVDQGGIASGALESAGCDLRAAARAGTLSDGQSLVRIDDDAAADGWVGCFADGDAFALAHRPAEDGGEITIVGGATVFQNGTIAQEGNAALALGLLGERADLVWYLPGPADVEGAAPTLADLTPGWVSPVLVLGALVAVAAGVWRGRRFGPLVAEDLPVDVPAHETAEGRARLYRSAVAREHALDQVRIAAVRRIAAVLRLPRSAPVDEVALAAAGATGRDPVAVHGVLVGRPPAGDREFVELSAAVGELEASVRAAVSPDSTRDPNREDPTGRRP